MSKVWRKLQRVGKKATKYRFTTFSHILTINCTSKWQPDKICITWARRERKIGSKLAQWEPGLKNVYEGNVYWERSTDFIEFDVSLYRGINDDKFEEKEWCLLIESEDSKGKRSLLATAKFCLNEYASIEPLFQTDVRNLKLKTVTNKIISATISFSLSCQFLKDGKATDEDMISIASFMSTASTSNPYLNSNVMFNKNSSNKSNTKPYNLNMNDLDNDITENSSSQGESSNLDEVTENLDNYLKLKTSQANFNSISNNFGNQIQQVTTDFQSDFLKIFDKNETDNVLSTAAAAAAMMSVENLANPFIEPIEQTTNPFMENTLNATQENELNPFLSPSLTNSLEEEDATNPFFNDVSIVKENEHKTPLPPQIKNKTLPIIGKTTKTTSRNSSSLNLSSTSKDLLDWCRTVVNVCRSGKSLPVFQNVSINDFSDSWKSGLAFCAIIYHFRPNLIDLNVLNENKARQNLSQVFRASDAEKIGRVLDYNDILNKASLDQLLIITYLFQLRDHFEPKSSSKQLNKLGLSFMTPSKPKKPTKEFKLKTNNTSTPIRSDMEKLPSQKVSSNPFDSDTEEKIDISNVKIESDKDKIKVKKTIDSSSSTSEELVQKAKELIEKTKQAENPKREELNQKVKNLIESRKKSTMLQRRATATQSSLASLENEAKEPQTLIGTEYVNQEIIHFKNEQDSLDLKAGLLERQLRTLMNSEQSGKKKTDQERDLEDRLLKEWFLLINRKNALLHRQQELEIIQNEKDLEKRYEMLSEKLRELMQINDFNKTSEQKSIESILLNELLNNVMERNELVLQLDEENKLLNEGEIINEFIQNKQSFQPNTEKSCLIQ